MQLILLDALVDCRVCGLQSMWVWWHISSTP